MKKIVKRILGVSFVLIAFSFSIISEALAQSCAVAPTCESLGYTKSAADCEGHDFLKCPFDTSVGYCDSGSGNNTSSKCNTPLVGSFLYSDMSCSANLDQSKTVIGVIFNPTFRLAIALDGKNAIWSNQKLDISGLENKTDTNIEADWSGKTNTKIIIDFCKANNITCAVAEYAYSYKTAGTNAGDWYLPAGGELKSIYDNMSTLNSSLAQVSGTALPSSYIWSSSENSSDNVWKLNFSDGTWKASSKNSSLSATRPIINF